MSGPIRNLSRFLRAPLHKRQANRLIEQLHAEKPDLERLIERGRKLGTHGFYRVSTLQIPSEIRDLARAVERLQPRIILEIGTARGGTSLIWAYLARERVITCDIEGHGGFSELLSRFPPPGSACKLTVLTGDSHDPRFVLEVLDRPIVPLPEPNMFMRETLLRDKDRKSTGRISEGENGNVNATRNVNTTRNVNAKRNARTGRNAPAKNASIQTDGSLVEWGPWSFRYLMHQREGLTIYTLSYNSNNIARNGNQRIANGARSIAYRMSVSEMVVPYGDTASHWIWRSAFDVGEYGIGMLAAPLVRGKDVPSNAIMTGLPAVASNGDVSYRENIVAIYEADAGLAWKHYDVMSGAHMEERGRELVITQTSTIGNYDYALSWIFNLNGTITFDAALSGILLTKGTQDTVYAGSEGNQKLAHLIAKNLLAPSHQHFFNVRLDMDIDDTANVVSEVDMVRRPVGKENPFGNAIMMDDWEFRYEKEATTNSNADAGRSWKIASTKTSSIGIPTAYTLHPNDGPPSFLDASNLARRRASFLIHDLWVTRYSCLLYTSDAADE